MKRILALLAAAITMSANAQTPQGKQIIEKLCGCFEVSFKYAETFSPDANYKYHEREETGGTAELALSIEVTDKKIVIQHLSDQLLVEEKGINNYKRLDDKECAAAKEYWKKNEGYWGRVRKAWASYLDTRNSIKLQNKVEGKMLHEYLLEQAKDFVSGKIKLDEIDTQINKTIAGFFTK